MINKLFSKKYIAIIYDYNYIIVIIIIKEKIGFMDNLDETY